MKLSIKSQRSVTSIQFLNQTKLDLRTHKAFRSQIMESYDRGNRVHLNMENLKAMDSAGLSALIYVRKKILESGGRLIITNLNENVYNLLKISGLIQIFDIYTSLETAVAISHKHLKGIQDYRAKPGLFLQVKHTNQFSLVRIKHPNWLTSENCLLFEKKIQDYLTRSNIVILNFDNIRNIDSSGIATIIELKLFAKSKAKTIILVYKNRLISRLFRMYSIEEVLPHFEKTEDAIFSTGKFQHLSRIKTASTDGQPPSTPMNLAN